MVAKRRVRAALKLLASVRSTSEGVERLAGAQGEVRKFLDAAVTELKLSAGSIEKEGIKERIASRLERIEAAYGRRILRGTGVLATIGATAPFVGLFGTVWGIMNSFIGILEVAHHQSRRGRAGHRRGAAGDRVRAPAAAIPAVVIYNLRALDRRLSRNTGRRRWRKCCGGQPRPERPAARRRRRCADRRRCQPAE